MNDHYDVIVIGAGVGGLAAAGLLARSGRSVLMLERHAVVGGCCSTFRRAHFVFDAAVHAIGGCASDDFIGSWLRELNIENEIEFAKLHPFYTVCIADQSFAIPANVDELEEVLIALSPNEIDGVRNFIRTIKILGHSLLNDNKSSSLQHTSILEQTIRMSWSDFLAEYFSSSKLILIMSAICVYAGLEPDKVSAVYMANVLNSYHRGAYYPLGSTQRFVDTLAQAIKRRDGEIIRRATVDKVLLDGQRVRGVRFTYKKEVFEVSAPVVISNADAYKTLYEWVGTERLPLEFQRRYRKLERSVSALSLYLGVREAGLALPNHEAFCLSGWEPLTAKQFYYTAGREEIPVISLCVPSLTDSSLAPAGHHVISLMTLAHTEEVEALRDQEGKQFLEQDLLRYAEKLIPGVTGQVLYKELATPRTIERYTNNGGGAMYGWAKSARQWPMSIASGTPIQGLHLAGHWTRGGHGIYGAFRSGVLTARAILEQELSTSAAYIQGRS